MKQIISILAILLICTLVFTGCSAGSDPADTSHFTVVETETIPLSFAEEIAQAQKVVDTKEPTPLKVGDEMTISLKENPSTGYQWNVTVSGGLKIMNDTFVPPQEQQPGAGGEHQWTIQGVTTGNQTFSGVYYRPWEEVTTEDVTYHQTILVLD
ncbi:MAG TPA: protease inhibitor I42 family protein [Methanospirillum sp.]|nr:protease inhibitor I42 family protein [Methanospirillum sp.]